jgi:hypothetical protein
MTVREIITTHLAIEAVFQIIRINVSKSNIVRSPRRLEQARSLVNISMPTEQMKIVNNQKHWKNF